MFWNRSKNICKSGAGEEANKGEFDTPGFELRDSAEVVRENGKHLKLQMPRNHGRVNQTSIDMLRSWRGNCDVQILIYESHPDNPNIKEISRVTDYVVAYNTKGNSTQLEEIQTMKNLILATQDTFGDDKDLQNLSKKIMNKAGSRRLISKQEASVLLSDLPLTLCSEQIETISISKSTKLSIDGTSQSNKFIDHYAKRNPQHHHLSLHEFFPVFRAMTNKAPAVPHYVGVSGYPCFPVSEAYARHVLIVYKPWLTYPNQTSWKRDFDIFINSHKCPKSARLTYDRVMQRHYDGTKYVDPKAADVDHSKNAISKEDEAALLLAGMGLNHSEQKSFDISFYDAIDKGRDYNWSKPPKVCFIATCSVWFTHGEYVNF